MIKKIINVSLPLIILFTLIIHPVISLQNNMVTINQLESQVNLTDGEPFPGYTLFAPEYYKNTFLIDNNGTIANLWESNYAQALGTYLLDNGNMIRACAKTIPNNNFLTGGFTGRVEMFDWNGNLVWEFEYANKTVCLHHDIEVLPNGNILMIAWEKKDFNTAVSAGRDPDTIPMDELWPDFIIEVEPTGSSGGNIVWEWHVWDHLIQDFDETKENYGSVETHPELIDINFDGRTYQSVDADIHHINAIDYNEELDQILLSVHNFCEIWIIDHSTTTSEAASHNGGQYGMGGDLLYRWGNPQSYRKGDASDRKLFSQHDAQWIASDHPGEGHILYFNNGFSRQDVKYSSVEEIILPLNEMGTYDRVPGTAYGPDELFWNYTAENKTEFYSNMISGAQRLPNGNTLICEGTSGYFFEVTYEKELVWDYFNIYPKVFDDVFHIHRYPLDYPGIGPLKYQNPEKPEIPQGESSLLTANEYSFESSTTDPNDDKISYLFDWGDGTDSGWKGYYNSGEKVSVSHVWGKDGTYNVKVKARDDSNLESMWSDPLTVTVIGQKVFLMGIVDSKTEREDEIGFWANKLILFSLNPFDFQRYPDGAYIIINKEYQGLLTNNIIFGRFIIIQKDF